MTRDPAKINTKSKVNRLLMAWGSIAVVAMVGAASVLSLDKQWSGVVRQYDLPGDFEKLVNLSEAAAHGFGVTAVLLTVLVGAAREKRKAVWGAILFTATAGILANISKASVARVRPHSVDLVSVEPAQVQYRVPVDERSGVPAVVRGETEAANELSSDQLKGKPKQLRFWDSRQRSFPSGHSATAWGLAIGLSLVYPRISVLLCIWASLACFQRITSGAHYPSDVFAGIAVAFISATFLYAIPRVRMLFEVNEAHHADI